MTTELERIEQQQQKIAALQATVGGWGIEPDADEPDADEPDNAQPTLTAEQVTELKARPESRVPEWETPSHEEIDLATVSHEDLGLDPYDWNNPLVRKIYEVHDKVESLNFVPTKLKAKPNWVRWQLKEVNGRMTKVPYQLNGNKASSTDPATWTTFEAISKDAVMDETQGIGIMTDGSFIGFDLDGCRNPATGEIKEWAQRVIDALGAYTEITPSGYGVRVYVFGQLPPGGARRFSIATVAGFGDKVGIECYSDRRYFAVTGNRVGSTSTLESRNVAEAYQTCADISREFPSEKRITATGFTGNDSDSSLVFIPGTQPTTKLNVLMYGKITSQRPFEIQDEHGSKVTASSQSEADMSLATLLAMKHGNNPELIDQEFRESSLHRPKWERDDYRNNTITKAIESAKKNQPIPVVHHTQPAQAQTDAAVNASAGATGSFLNGVSIDISDENYEKRIPEFDESVITGIYRDIVDVAVGGTTIPRQFAFLAAKTYMGARMAGKVTFEGLDSDSSYYAAAIGETGTGKRTSWDRTFEKTLTPPGMTEQLKLIYSADSGAGLKDAFFEPPDQLPVVCFIDEVTTLGHKAGEKKNPEILDTMVELADSHRISRVKAKRGKEKSMKTHDNARLSVFMCGQDGPAYMGSFTARTKLGWFDRLYPEFSEPVEAGDLPEIAPNAVAHLHGKIAKLNFHGKMTMSAETKSQLDAFWKSQPGDIRRKVRFKKYLMLDMYMAAFGRGLTVAEPEDLDVAIKIFKRQIVIRQVMFTGEVPDRIGFYISKIKAIVEAQRKELNRGKTMAQVAKSLRDFQTMTNAFRDNELHTFERAWKSMSEHVREVAVVAGNGQKYQKWVPMPYEDEMWLQTAAA